MKSKSSLSLVLGVSLLLTSFAALAWAQESKAALRILAVGNEPPFIQKIVNGVRVQQPPPPGELPPQSIALTNKDGGQIGAPMAMALGSISRVLPVSPGKVPLHEVTNGAIAPKAFHSLKMPKTAAGLAIVWRDPRSKKWPNALSLTLKDDATSFAPGKARIVNVSGKSVRVTIQAKGKKKENFTLPRGKFLQRPGASVIEIYVQVNARWKRIYAAAPLQNKTSRVNLVVYDSDGITRNAIEPVKVRAALDRGVTPKIPKPKRD